MDLDSTVQTQNLPEGVLVRQRNFVTAFAIGAGRLFWATDREVRGCLESDCASSLVTYFAQTDNYPYAALFLAQRGSELVWVGESGVYSSPVDGSRRPVWLGEWRQGHYFLTEDAVLAVVPDGLYTLPLKGGGWTPLRRLAEASRFALAEHDGYAYWAEAISGMPGARVVRARLGADTPLEIVAREGDGEISESASLAFDDSFVYFPDSRQVGGIWRCPLAGCRDEPEQVLGPVRAPSWIDLDEKGLCVLHEVAELDAEVACASLGEQPLQPRLKHVFWATTIAAMDAKSVYAPHYQSSNANLIGDVIDIEKAAR